MTQRRHKRGGVRRKTISAQGIAGQKGINLIEGILLKMGSRWTACGANEVGIDGYIELFDPTSRLSLGLTVAVQSKVVSAIREATEEFRYTCDAGDLDYWLKSNIPVILIVSDPETEQAYWVWLQDAFPDWKPGNPTTVLFRKDQTRFDANALTELVRIGAPTRGLYIAPRPEPERLWSNLLKIDGLPDLVFVGSTQLRERGEVWRALNNNKANLRSGWILWEKKIISFDDLSADDWDGVCEPGTVEGFETEEWAESADSNRRRLFVQLLNSTFRTQVESHLRFWPKDECFAIAGRERRQSYKSLKRTSGLSVVSKFSSKSKDGRIFDYWRHMAFRAQFRFFDDAWFLEITPTYRFTTDGFRKDKFHESRLKKIKEIEGNRAVLSSVLFWADYLQPKDGLFSEGSPLIVFGKLKTMTIGVGIDDKSWQQNDPETAKMDQQSSLQGLLQMGPSIGEQE